MGDYERAANGAALLDKVEPGWFEKIDAASLDIGSFTKCVLGQVYGGYADGMNKLRASEHFDSGEIHGFSNATPEVHEAWREQIARRRLAAVPVAAA